MDINPREKKNKEMQYHFHRITVSSKSLQGFLCIQLTPLATAKKGEEH